MKEIISMHGWASDSSIWATWEKYFIDKGWLWQNNDRGYGVIQDKEASWIQSSKENIPCKRAIICHSLGLHLIKPDIFKNATDVVLISSFGRFITNGPENRSLKTALEGMQKALGNKNEVTMLTKFLLKACSPYQFKTIPAGLIPNHLSLKGRQKLQSDLNLLINTKGIPHGLPKSSKLLTIFGEKDSILAPSTIISLLNELDNHLKHPPTHWMRANEGHFLFKPDLIKSVEEWLGLIK